MKTASRRTKIIVGAMGATLGVIGIVFALFWALNPAGFQVFFGGTTAEPEAPIITRETENTDGIQGLDIQAATKASELQVAGGSAQAVQAVFDEAIETADTNQEKGIIALQALDTFASAQEWDDALEAGLQAELYLSDSTFLPQATSNIAYVYAEQGNETAAREYYKKTLDIINEDNSIGYDVEYYREKAGV